MPQEIAHFDNSYAQLPKRFYERIDPVAVKSPRLIELNVPLAHDLGLNFKGLSAHVLAAIFSGNTILPGAEPIALAYAGHQFGHFVPQLGDGRAVLLGEVIDSHGRRQDIQLKGSGQTMFSRRGDGRAALGPMIREYIVSEAMHALGIPTTRSLALVATGESVFRETELPGAILTRVASSHIRVGTFEYFASRQDEAALKQLADYVIARHYPEASGAKNPYLALVEAVRNSQASLIAHWMRVGFIHGVMNTDNTALSGETIDYGPCAFMDAYDPETVFSSIDRNRRYAFGNQPAIAQWNLAIFAECLLPVIHTDSHQALSMAQEVIDGFQDQFQNEWLKLMGAKIGIAKPQPTDRGLIESFLNPMQENHADYMLSFRNLSNAIEENNGDNLLKSLFPHAHDLDIWLQEWRQRLLKENQKPLEVRALMNRMNPAFIPRNHRVEQAIDAAQSESNFSKMEHLMAVLSKPYDDQPENAEFMLPPKPGERVYQTFCGT